MKKIGKGLVFALALAGMVLVGSGVFTFKSATTSAAEKPENVTLNVDGMTCGMCAGRVKEVLDKVSDVKDSEVDWKNGTAIVQVTKGSNHKALEDAVKKAGFKVTSIKCECKG